MNSKRKGKVGELELAKFLREQGFEECRRSVQYNGKAKEGDSDVVGLPGIHAEVKRVERLNINDAMAQAIRDCPSDSGKIPAVFHHKNRSGWLVQFERENGQ